MIFSEPRIPILVALSLLVALSWITLSLRVWVRVAISRSFGWDDGFLILSVIIFTGLCTSCVLIEASGHISHADDLETAQLSSLVNLVLASTELYIGTLVFLKIAIASIYLRVVNAGWQRYTVLATLFFSTMFGIIMFHLTLLNCGDPTRYLENALENACMSADSLYAMQMSAYAANALTDWILIILPIFILVKTAMPVSARLAAAGVLILGYCASFVSLVRVVYIRDLTDRQKFFGATEEITFWALLECGFGILPACAVALGPLLAKLTRDDHNVSRRIETLHTSKPSDASSAFSQQSIDVRARDGATTEPTSNPFYETEGQSKSHFSIISVTPAIRRLRVLSRLGLSYFNLNGGKDDANPTDGDDSANVVRRSTLEKSAVNGRLEMSRKLTVREKEISHPIPLVTRMDRPTVQRGGSQQELPSAGFSHCSQ